MHVCTHTRTHTSFFFINLKHTHFLVLLYVLLSMIYAMPFIIKIYLNAFSIVIKIFQPFKISIHVLHCNIIIHLTLLYFPSPCISIDSVDIFTSIIIIQHREQQIIIHFVHIYSEYFYIFEFQNKIIYLM